jgi:ABC-type transport system involved in multi-copper enzyme maturation permease subunit
MIRPDFYLLRLVLVMMAGRRYWLLPLLPLAWLVFLQLELFSFFNVSPEAVQGLVLGVPMSLLGIFLGIRVIAGEIDDRSLELAYTVPGGSERLWRIKLIAAVTMLLVMEATLALVTVTLITGFPLGALYGAFQAACFYLVLSLSLATLFRSQIGGGVFTVILLGINGALTGFGNGQLRGSPFFNPYVIVGADSADVLAWTVQNRVGMLLLMAGILSLAFMRANRRERMLSS